MKELLLILVTLAAFALVYCIAVKADVFLSKGGKAKRRKR